jgi:exopolyphosphatase / guanosine-5'-triphosphate,3'-diphosphate pyrophosphatase
MVCACIDIGSNTTRLLVADCDGAGLSEVHQDRVFTRLGPELRGTGRISPAKVAEIVEVVGRQRELARDLGTERVSAVATAALRRAENRDELLAALEAGCGLAVTVLTGEEEARLAFRGAAGTLEAPAHGPLAVVDVGGGSSEIAVGLAAEGVSWWRSLEIGSGVLAQDCFTGDPPGPAELACAGAVAGAATADLDPPSVAEAVAVGGSATSLGRLAGRVLDPPAITRAVAVLASLPAGEVARRFTLDVERVRLLPAGLLILEQISRRLGVPLRIGRGGVREGVLLNGAP